MKRRKGRRGRRRRRKMSQRMNRKKEKVQGSKYRLRRGEKMKRRIKQLESGQR